MTVCFFAGAEKRASSNGENESKRKKGKVKELELVRAEVLLGKFEKAFFKGDSANKTVIE